MKDLNLPFDQARIRELISRYPTPFHIYDERGIRQNARRLLRAFAWNTGFREFFAVKAAPNPHLLRILKEEGFGADCSSLPELILSERVGILGEAIMFTSNDTPAKEYIRAKEMGATLNLDDITHIEFLATRCGGLPDLLSFRYNPGPRRSGNVIIGNPAEAKYGLTREQLFQAYRAAKERGVTRFGLHTMVASNELDRAYFVETARMLFDLARELKESVGVRLEFVNLGGGIGIPYRPEQTAVDLEALAAEIRELYQQMIVPAGLDPLARHCGRRSRSCCSWRIGASRSRGCSACSPGRSRGRACRG
jgi:diaminopimelate decarboxylase